MEKNYKNKARELFLSEDNYNNADVSSGQYIETEEEIYERLVEENKEIVIDLCAGTKSWSKGFLSNVNKDKYRVISIDILGKHNPDIVCDVLLWDYKGFLSTLSKMPSIVIAGPPCTEYSKAKSRGVRNIEFANSIVLKCIEIIEYVNPKVWFIENPQTGLLKNQEFMKDLPFTDVSYCKYGYTYRKQTRLWNNIDFKGLTCNKDCDAMDGNKHIGSAGNGRREWTFKSFSQDEKYSMPPLLIQSVIEQIEEYFNKTL